VTIDTIDFTSVM